MCIQLFLSDISIVKSAVSVLKDNDTKAIENFINGNRLSRAINVFGNQ